MNEENMREIVVPGEIILKGREYLPGEGTSKQGEEIVARRFGLVEEVDRIVKVIPLSGVYQPRRGNVVIGKVEMVTFNGWVINIGASDNGFLSLMEVPRFVNKDALDEVMDIGDIVIAKIWNINKRGIDLSLKLKGLGKVDEGLIVKINSNKVPRVIGKEGSMVNIIKNNTNCNITVGQNGYVLIEGKNVEDELLAKKAIQFIEEKSYVQGLTEEVEKFFRENQRRVEK